MLFFQTICFIITFISFCYADICSNAVTLSLYDTFAVAVTMAIAVAVTMAIAVAVTMAIAVAVTMAFSIISIFAVRFL